MARPLVGAPESRAGRRASDELSRYRRRASDDFRAAVADAVRRVFVTASVRVWRIATDTPDYGADDSTGEGARRSGGRWNRSGVQMLYASRSQALACLEV